MTETTDRNRWIALYVLCAGVLMIVLDVTVVNVALPTIQNDLGFSQNDLAWVVNAYLISFGGLLLLAGRFGDLLGRKSIFMYGLVLFTIASLVCGLSDSQAVLVIARFIQGIGGAMTSAVVLGMIVTMFPEPREQAKAMGVYAFVASAGGSVGLLAGGILTQAISWHWIFFINIPIGIATGLLASRLIERDKGIGMKGGADVPGAILITSSLMLGVYTIVKPAAEQGWGSGGRSPSAPARCSCCSRSSPARPRAQTPLIPLRIFRSRNVSGANALQALLVAGMFGMFFLGSLYMQQVLGYDPLQIGFAFLPATLVMGVLSLRYAETLVMRFGARRCATRDGVIAIGLVLFARVPVDGIYVRDVLPTMIIIALGIGVSFPALMTLAMSGATPEDAGLASGLVNTTAQVGGAIGLAVLATVSASRSETLAAAGKDTAEALAVGTTWRS